MLHVIIFKSEYFLWRDNKYIEKLVTEKLSQIAYDFSNI
jgi:hypothetical protein